MSCVREPRHTLATNGELLVAQEQDAQRAQSRCPPRHGERDCTLSQHGEGGQQRLLTGWCDQHINLAIAQLCFNIGSRIVRATRVIKLHEPRLSTTKATARIDRIKVGVNPVREALS